jgi:hypothetical protein
MATVAGLPKIHRPVPVLKRTSFTDVRQGAPGRYAKLCIMQRVSCLADALRCVVACACFHLSRVLGEKEAAEVPPCYDNFLTMAAMGRYLIEFSMRICAARCIGGTSVRASNSSCNAFASASMPLRRRPNSRFTLVDRSFIALRHRAGISWSILLAVAGALLRCSSSP